MFYLLFRKIMFTRFSVDCYRTYWLMKGIPLISLLSYYGCISYFFYTGVRLQVA